MKKLLSILGSLILTAISTTSVIACNTTKAPSDPSPRVDLTEHLSKKMIGAFNHEDPSDDELLARLKLANPTLKTNEIVLTRNSLNQDDNEPIKNEATITVKETSTSYHPKSVMIYFTDATHPRLGLINVLKNTDLGELIINENGLPLHSDVLERLQQLNPDLNMKQLNFQYVNSTSKGGQINLSLIDDNNYYIDKEYTLTYRSVSQLIDLSSVIENTNLGEVWFNRLAFDNNDRHLIDLVKNINPKLQTSEIMVTSVDQINGFFIVNVKDNSEVYKHNGFIRINYQPLFEKYLSEDITNTDLGEFNVEPTDSQILRRVKKLNPNLNTNGIYVASNTNNQVVIRELHPSSNYLDGTITLNYKVNKVPLLQSIGDVIIRKDFPVIDISSPNHKANMLRTLQLRNPKVLIEELDVIENHPGYITFKVREDRESPIYSAGSVEVSYITYPSNQIKNDLTNMQALNSLLLVYNENLAFNWDIFYETFIRDFQFFNNKVVYEEVEFKNAKISLIPGNDLKSRLTFDLIAKPNSNYYPSSMDQKVSLAMDIYKRQSLTNLFKNLDLGTFSKIPNVTELLNRIYELNLFNSVDAKVFKTYTSIISNNNNEVILSLGLPNHDTFPDNITFKYSIEQLEH